MRVLFATAEFAPLARVGGLAAASAGLVHELRRQGVDVEVVLPDYGDWTLADEVIEPLPVPAWVGTARARSGVHAEVGEVTLIDLPGLRRPHPYADAQGNGWPDNDHRFFAFSAAVAACCMAHPPDVLHLNDWHSAATLAFIAEPPPTVLTVHTLGYQGRTSRGWLDVFEHRRDAYLLEGDCNPMAGAIRCADLVVAVSPRYAWEITTPLGGFGLHQLLESRADRLVGILNGIDDTEWDPSADPHLPAPYSADDLTGKAASRAALLAELELPVPKGPVIGVVSRLVDQKGIDLLLPAAPFLGGLDAALVVLGDGDAKLADWVGHVAGQYPQRVHFHRGYDERLAHLITAGADLFAMPSRFEPCGLAQMQAMRYGTLPVVTDVGGLHDTVVDIDARPTAGTGVVIPWPTTEAVIDGLHRGARAWSNGRRRGAMQRRAMGIDWSWRNPAKKQIDWYQRLTTSV
jgi:starch synthase